MATPETEECTECDYPTEESCPYCGTPICDDCLEMHYEYDHPEQP